VLGARDVTPSASQGQEDDHLILRQQGVRYRHDIIGRSQRPLRVQQRYSETDSGSEVEPPRCVSSFWEQAPTARSWKSAAIPNRAQADILTWLLYVNLT
jgi:hypothetical protein